MTDKLISDLTEIAAPLGDNDQIEVQRSGQTTSEHGLMSDFKTYIQSWLTKAMVGLGNTSNVLHNFTATADPVATNDSASNYSVGSLWYRDDTTELWFCIDATTNAAVWVPRNGQFSSARNRFYGFNDCVIAPGSGSFSDAWSLAWTGTGAQISAIATGSNNALGIWSLDLGTTTTGKASFGSAALTSIKLGSGRARYEAKVAIHVLSNGTDTFSTRIGFIDNIGGESVDGVFFRYTDSINSGKWQAVTRSNNTETAVDTGIAAVADTFALFKVDVNAPGTSAAFYINDALVATITTNIPIGAGRETAYGVFGLKSAGTTATSGAYVDFAEVEYLFTTKR